MTLQELTPKDVFENKNKYVLVDVREPFELTGPESKIEGAVLAPLGSSFVSFLETANPNQAYVFICKGGYRSLQACQMAALSGFSQVYNLKGGMIAWNHFVK
jgi:rhodanese-related sulfurtransferase